MGAGWFVFRKGQALDRPGSFSAWSRCGCSRTRQESPPRSSCAFARIVRRRDLVLPLRSSWPRRRAGWDHVRCSRQCVRRGPAASPDLTFPTSVAAPGHQAGDDHVLRDRQCAQSGPAVSAGLASPTSGAAPSCRLRSRTVQPSVRAKRGPGGAAMPYIPYERCGAMPQCRT